jgi:hypothetical protein
MLVATDSLGSLWMVPMKDILEDIASELSTVEIKLLNSIEDVEAANEDVQSTNENENIPERIEMQDIIGNVSDIQKDPPKTREEPQDQPSLTAPTMRDTTIISSETSYLPMMPSTNRDRTPHHYEEAETTRGKQKSLI